MNKSQRRPSRMKKNEKKQGNEIAQTKNKEKKKQILNAKKIDFHQTRSY